MEALGVNPVFLTAQAVSFLILFWVFNKFLYGKIQQALDDRRRGVAQIFKDKEELAKRLGDMEKEQEAKRKEIKELSRKLEEEAKKSAEIIRKDLVSKAEVEGQREVTKAQERISQEVNTAKKELVSEVKKIALEMAEKTLKAKAGDKEWQKKEIGRNL